ncbi:hypothetical protein Tco_1271379 [Tanacetum coccineum]
MLTVKPLTICKTPKMMKKNGELGSKKGDGEVVKNLENTKDDGNDVDVQVGDLENIDGEKPMEKAADSSVGSSGAVGVVPLAKLPKSGATSAKTPTAPDTQWHHIFCGIRWHQKSGAVGHFF